MVAAESGAGYLEVTANVYGAGNDQTAFGGSGSNGFAASAGISNDW